MKGEWEFPEKDVEMVGRLLLELVPEADNAYEATDLYCTVVYRRMMLKQNCGVGFESDLEMYLWLKRIKRAIGEIVHREAVRCDRREND